MPFKFLVVLLAALVVSAVAHPASAQSMSYRGSSDNPNGPTVSPYLNLLQNNSVGNAVTGAPVYQSLVQPLVNQGNAIGRQAGALSQLQQQVYTGSTAGSATGHASFFMNYSHYYPGFRPGGGNRTILSPAAQSGDRCWFCLFVQARSGPRRHAVRFGRSEVLTSG